MTPSAETPAEISVIVVNYGTADLAIAAVESVLHNHVRRTVDVHLVDNPTPAGTNASQIAAAHESRGWGERVTLHLEDTNHGFGRGNNVALRALAARETPPDKVFLLNPDAELTETTLDILARLLDDRPDLAIAGCAIERPGSAGRVSAAFRFPTLRGEFAAGALFGPVSRAFAAHATAHPPSKESGPVDWVSGAALMARFSALREVDFFDPAYFLYFEETDLMYRLKRAGWGIWFEAGAHVVHEAGAATGLKSSRSAEGSIPAYWYDSWRLYFLKNHGRGYALATASARMAGWALHRVVRAMLRRPSIAPRGFAGMFTGHVIRPLLFGRP